MSESGEDNKATEYSYNRVPRTLDEIEQFFAPIQAESRRAVEFSKANSRTGHFIALAGIRDIDRVPLMASSASFGILPVDYPPSMTNLAAALKPECRSQYARLGSATAPIRYELWITGEAEIQLAVEMANRIVYLLRIVKGWSARAIGYADTSWNAVAGCEGSVLAQTLGEEWHQKEQFGAQTVSFEDVNWVDHNYLHAARLLKVEKFRLAFDAAGTAHLIPDLRMAISQAWAGIEALCDVSHELVYRLSLYLAVLIHDEPSKRLIMCKEVKTVYALRSKAVHGSAMTHSAQIDAAERSWTILRKALRALIELDEPIPDSGRYEQVLLGESLIRRQTN